MAEDGFCDFQTGMDQTLMAQISNFNSRHDQAAESYDGGSTSKQAGPGFYMDQYAAANMHGVAVPNIMMTHSMPPTTSSSASTAAAGLYEPNANYAMKPERGLPPTPPGSPPEDEKDSSMPSRRPQSSMALPSQYMLAKPLPMRRLSEKRIAQARSSMNTVAAPVESMLTESMLGQAAAAAAASGTSPTLARALAAVQQTQKRPRSEKKAIPCEQKDDRYFERRKRNNHAAKKSRDARKAREDEIAIRASFLEKENAILRAQVATLREEANSLKELLLQKRGRP